jgi:hypothetical protein
MRTDLRPEHFDWQASRPLKPWRIQRGRSVTPGYWELEWIEISWTHLMEALREAMVRGPGTHQASREFPLVEPAPPLAESVPASALRRRGPPATRFERVKQAMKNDILQGQFTLDWLDNAYEKTLADRYQVSRDTVRKARNAVVSELRGVNFRQTATNDK